MPASLAATGRCRTEFVRFDFSPANQEPDERTGRAALSDSEQEGDRAWPGRRYDAGRFAGGRRDFRANSAVPASSKSLPGPTIALPGVPDNFARAYDFRSW